MAGKAKAVLESDLRKILRDDARFPSGTVTFCEYGRGGDPGLPDTFIASGRGFWLPLELKRGDSVLKELRPAQRLWHKTSLRLGNPTFGAAIRRSGGSVLIYALTLAERQLGELLLEELAVDCMELPVIQRILWRSMQSGRAL